MKTIIAGLLLLISFTSCRKEIQNNSSILNTEILPTKHFSIDLKNDTILYGNKGTKLRIRQGTFVDKNGKTVMGKIDIELKEAYSMSDIILGGLTTMCDNQILQSGGMLYLNASSNGERLSVAANNSIGVSIPAKEKVEGMMLYSGIASTTTGKINWKDPVELSQIAELASSLNPSFDSITSSRLTISSTTKEVHNAMIEPEKPREPEMKKSGDTLIGIDFDPAEYPDLAIYKDVKFKLADKKNFNANDKDFPWVNIEIVSTDRDDIYEMRLTGLDFPNKAIQKSILVSPVFTNENDYNSALDVYKKKYNSYLKIKDQIAEAKIKEQIARAKEQERADSIFNEQQKLQVVNEIKNKESRINTTAQNIQDFLSNPQSEYTFTLSSLGWFNIDACFNPTNNPSVNIDVLIQNASEYDRKEICLAVNEKKIYLTAMPFKNNIWNISKYGNVSLKLPNGEKATIVAMGYKNGILYSRFIPIQIGNANEYSIELEKTSTDKLRSDLSKL